MFYRKSADELKKENKAMEKELRDMRRRRAEIRDEAGKAAAGAVVPSGTDVAAIKELQELLRYETIRKGHNALRARIAQTSEEMRTEVEKLKEENAAAECEIGEPMSLILTAPANGTEVKRGGFLEIKWFSTGPVADTLRIVLLANKQLIKMLSPEAVRRKGSFSWPVPTDFPGGEFRVVLQDAVSGLSSQDDLGKVKII